MVCEELHYSSLVLNANSKEKMKVTDSMEEISLKCTNSTTTEISLDTLVSNLQYHLKKKDDFHRFVAAKKTFLLHHFPENDSCIG
jgi:hypothetical protein